MSSIGSSGFDEGRREVSKEELNFFKDAFCKKESSLGRLRSFDVETKTKSVAGRLFKRSDISNDKSLCKYAFDMLNNEEVFGKLSHVEKSNCSKNIDVLFQEIKKSDPNFDLKKQLGSLSFEELSDVSRREIKEKGHHNINKEERKKYLESLDFTPNEVDKILEEEAEWEKKQRAEEDTKKFMGQVRNEPFAKEWKDPYLRDVVWKIPPHERETWIEEKRAEYKREQEGNRKDVEAEAIQLLKQRHGIGQMTFKSNSDVFLFIERELGIKKTDPRMQLIIVEIFHKAPSASSRTPSLDELLSGNKKFPEHVKDVIVEIAANKEFNNKYLKELKKSSSQLNEVLRKNIEPNVLQGRDPLFCIEEGLIRFPESLIVRLGNVDEVKHRNSELLHYIDEQFDSTETVLEGIFPDKQESEIRNGLKTGRLAFPREITKEYLNENYRVWKKEDR